MRKKTEQLRLAEEEKEARQQGIEMRKKNKRVATGIKPSIRRSDKPLLERREVKKEILSQGQIDIMTYLGIPLEDDEKKAAQQVTA